MSKKILDAVDRLTGEDARSRTQSLLNKFQNALSITLPREDVEALVDKWADALDIEGLFERQRARTQKAQALWRKAHPGTKDMIPDLGELLDWLMEEIAELTDSVKESRRLLETPTERRRKGQHFRAEKEPGEMARRIARGQKVRAP